MPEEPTKLRTIIVNAIANAAEIAPESLQDDLNLFDLGLDSLNFAGILIDIEDAVGEEIPAEVLDRFLDVGDVVTIRDVLNLLSTWDRAAADALGPYDYDEVVVVQQP